MTAALIFTACTALIVGLEIGLWLAPAPPPATDPDDIDWDNAA